MDVLESARGHKDGEGLGTCEFWEGKRATIVQPGEQKAQDDLCVCKHLLDGEQKCEAKKGSWRCPMIGQEAIGTNWNGRNFNSIRKFTFLVYTWSNTGIVCLERLRNLCPWWYLKFNTALSNILADPALNRAVGLDDPQRFFQPHPWRDSVVHHNKLCWGH